MVLLVALTGMLFPATASEAAGTAVLVGAGDIATCSSSNDSKTAALVKKSGADRVFTVGDNAYSKGTRQQFEKCYGPTWGQFKSKTRPAVGDNEYDTSGAKGYWGYFGSKAGPKGKGWYSYDLGSWHVVVLNSNCSKVGCGSSSEQVKWLRKDLASANAKCIAAIWHTPRFSSVYGNNSSTKPFWEALYDAGADIIVNGHHHAYERYAPQNPSGRADSDGIRQFLVGTGGAPLSKTFRNVQPNSQVRNAKTYGVLKLSLRSGGYDFDFIPVAGSSFSDSGSGSC